MEIWHTKEEDVSNILKEISRIFNRKDMDNLSKEHIVDLEKIDKLHLLLVLKYVELKRDVINKNKDINQQLQAKEEEIKELKDFVGYCFDLQLVGCSDTEKYEGIKNRADEILRQRGNK